MTPIPIRDERHAARLFRHFREQLRISRRDLAARLFVSTGTLINRELGVRGIPTDALIDTAHVLGFAVALVPQRHPGARDTGTGWPA